MNGPLPQSHESPPTEVSRFKDIGEAKTEVVQAYNDWTSMLTGRSVATSLGTIGANWAVHGNETAIMGNGWALWSVAVAIVFLGLDLAATWWMSHLFVRHLRHIDLEPDLWKRRWNERGKDKSFPYTWGIDCLGDFTRLAKVFLPVTAAALFLASLM